MIFLGADEIYSMLRAYRILWIRGRFGGGKTSLAVILAARLYADGVVDSVVSNIDISFASPPTVPLLRSAIVLDESWVYIDTRRSVERYAAYVRKLDHYLLMPSVYPPHARLAMLYVERVFNAYSVGLPMWIYRWVLNVRSVMERGYFGIWRPSDVFGFYDTAAIPVSDGGIGQAIDDTLRHYGLDVDRSIDDTDPREDIADEIAETSQAISDDIVTIREIVRSRTKRR